MSGDVPAEIRAIAARQGVSHAELARRCERSPMWLSRRLSPTAFAVDLSVDDLTLIAAALEVTPAEILELAAAEGGKP